MKGDRSALMYEFNRCMALARNAIPIAFKERFEKATQFVVDLNEYCIALEEGHDTKPIEHPACKTCRLGERLQKDNGTYICHLSTVVHLDQIDQLLGTIERRFDWFCEQHQDWQTWLLQCRREK